MSYGAKSWSLNINDQIIDVTTMLSSGWRDYISGLRGADFSVETIFDPTLAQLTPGQSLTNVTLSLGSSTEVVFNGIVKGLRVSTSVDNAAMLTIEGSATGVVNTTFA